MLVNAVNAEDNVDKVNLTDDNFDTIQDLIDNADPGDSIYLENKTYVGENNPIKINKDINIYGSESSTVLDANNTSRIFEISKNIKVNIGGLTITNGYSDDKGGAIYNQGTLNIFNSTVINNHAERGGIYCSDKSNLNIYNSKFDGNTADSGAAIENDNSNGVVNIMNSIFTYNACEEGGAIYNIWGQMNVYNSTFMYNTAERGGAIYNNRGTLKVYNTRVLSNTGTDLGAGIKSWGVCEVHDSIIINNTNPIRQGGGFYVSEFTLLLKNCIVSNNSAVYGGGVYVEAKAS